LSKSFNLSKYPGIFLPNPGISFPAFKDGEFPYRRIINDLLIGIALAIEKLPNGFGERIRTMQVSGTSSNLPGPNSTPDQIRKVAKEFEAIFASMMIKSMRKSVGENPLVPSSFGEDVYTEMLDNEYAKMYGSSSSIGLADQIAKQLEKMMKPENALNDLRAVGKDSPWSTDPRFIPQSTGSGDAKKTSGTGDSSGVLNKWNPLIEKASSLYNVDKNLISAVIMQESAGNPRAVSPKGAKGLMQLMDTTAQAMGVSRSFSPWENIAGGTKYLRLMLDKFGGDEKLAVASYNAGPAAVERYGTVPPYEETKKYVNAVLDFKQRLETSGAKEQL
jgi:Rod binding domain-containing protein